MDLGNYADLPKALNFNPGSKNLTLDNLYKVFGKLPNFPTDIKVNRGSTHIHEGVEITELSWSTGYGPLTQSYLLKPAGVDKKLPLVLFLHSHDDLKGYGKEKLVDTKDGVPAQLLGVRRDHYGNRASANELAKRGYVVREHTRDEIVEIYEVRASLEGMAARLAAQKAGTAAYKEIEKIGAHKDSLITSNDRDLIVDLNDQFHAAIFTACGNSRLERINRSNSKHFFNHRIAQMYTKEETKLSIKGHAAILKAIKNHDADEAESTAQQHVFDALEVTLLKLRQLSVAVDGNATINCDGLASDVTRVRRH